MITIATGQRIETPEGVFYKLENNGVGNIYKNGDAYVNRPDEVCYVPEYAAKGRKDGKVPENKSNCYTHKDLLALCGGNEEMCDELFYELEWTFPKTKLEEWDIYGNDDDEEEEDDDEKENEL